MVDEYTKRHEDAMLWAKAHDVIREMQKVEGFALTEDTYTARIPGATLRKWHDVVQKLVFRLAGTVE